MSKNRTTIILSLKSLKKAIDEEELKINNVLYEVCEDECTTNFGSLPDNTRWKARWDGVCYIAKTDHDFTKFYTVTYDDPGPYKPPRFEIQIYPSEEPVFTKPAVQRNTNNASNSNNIIDSSEKK